GERPRVNTRMSPHSELHTIRYRGRYCFPLPQWRPCSPPPCPRPALPSWPGLSDKEKEWAVAFSCHGPLLCLPVPGRALELHRRVRRAWDPPWVRKTIPRPVNRAQGNIAQGDMCMNGRPKRCEPRATSAENSSSIFCPRHTCSSS